jgi:non-specific serine/threonine protein kinase
VLDLLAALIDKSLLQVQSDGAESRFLMLETVREYALERLSESGEAEEIAAAHAAFMATFVERAEPDLMGPQERQWVVRCNAELGNIRAALTWSLEHDNTIALRIAAALWVYWFWEILPEGLRWMSAAVERISDEPTLVRARAFTTHGALAILAGHLAIGGASATRAIPLAIEAQNSVVEGMARWVKACSHFNDGLITSVLSELDHALTLMDQATTSTVRVQACLARTHRSVGAFVKGDVAGGIALYEEAMERTRAAGSDAMMLMLLGDFAGWLVALGEVTRARAMVQEALALAQGHVAWLAVVPLSSLALVSAIEGGGSTAAQQIGAIEVAWRRGGLDMPFHIQQRIDRAAALAKSQLSDEVFTAAVEAGGADPEAVFTAARGTTVKEGSPASTRAAGESGLSARQREVLALMVAGRSDQQIAEMLFISRRTASHHVSAIMTKLNVRSRGEAAVYGIRAGLI